MVALTHWAISILAGCLCLLTSASNACAEEITDPFPGAALSYILKVNGKTLWGHKPHLKLPPASLTKVMTGLIVLEKSRVDEVVAVSQAASKETGTRLGLRQGEKMPVASLLAVTLMESANDACRSLADHVGGGGPKFVALMNRRAKELGMRRTHFTNPCGHDHPHLYSTAHDLAILAEAALKNRTFAEIVKLVYWSVRTVEGRSFTLENKNELIGRYPGAIGIKTGYTPKAGKCLIALAERDGMEALLVLLNAPNRWWDSEAMLDKAFASTKAAGNP